VKLIPGTVLALLCAGLCAAAATAATTAAARPARAATEKAKGSMTETKTAPDAPFWTGNPGPEEFRSRQEARLERARALVAKLSASNAPHTLENTLRVYDDALLELDAVGSQSSLMENVHPDSAVRSAAEKLSQEASALSTELQLNRQAYDAIAAIPTTGLDPETRYYLEKTLREFRLAGVDKDEATRKKVKQLNDELVVIGQDFSRNIREDKRPFKVDAKELDGLPADFVARHKPDAAGQVTLTVDYPDAGPVFSYAISEALRRRMYMEFNNRAYPKNMEVLNRMIAKRNGLATLLGFPSWAEYTTANKMVGNAKNARDFIDKIVDASKPRAEADYAVLLARKQKEVPDAKVVNAWEATYYSELVRKSDFDFDSQKMRPYLPYDEVKQGVLDVASRMFSVTFKRVPDAPVWDKSVECYEMWDGGKLAGRFYLDMHPRADKYNHAAQFDVRTGVKGRQIPEAALICNFPGGDPGDPGLMEFNDAKTFFHEFGHLLHTLFAGNHRWVGTGGIRTEQDFVEAPSQLLEEWMMDAKVLQAFARNYQTHEPIPTELVTQMRRANEFGKGLGVRRQMVYANTSLSYYDRDPSKVDMDGMIKQFTEDYQPFPFVDGTHFECSFGHLDGYSAVYYTYMWSLVIAKDMFSAFDKANLLDPKIPTRYRQVVLAPGGSKPAAQLVQDFLGRPFGFESYRTWLNQEVPTASSAKSDASGSQH